MKRLLYILCASIVGTAFADNENFDGLDKSGADFSGASLKNSSWVGATVSDASFTNADISGATFDSTTGFTANQLYSTKNYATDNTLENLTLSNLGELGYLDLSGKTLNDVGIKNNKHSEGKVGINLTNAKLNNVNFSGTEINVSGWRRNYAYGINLTGATVKNLILSNSKIEAANAGYGIYINTDIDGLDLSNSTINGGTCAICGIGNTTIKGLNLSNAKISSGDYSNFGNIESSNFNEAVFESNGSSTVRFGNIKDSIFKNTCFSSTNSYGEKIGAYFGGTLENVDFTDATIAGSSFSSKTNLSIEMLKQTSDYKSGIFDSVKISCKLDGFDMSGKSFVNGYLAELSNSNFSKADLSGTNIGSGQITNTSFSDAIIYLSTIGDYFTKDMFYETSDYKNGKISLTFRNVKMDGWNFSNKTLENVTFEKVNLLRALNDVSISNVDYSGATLINTKFESIQISDSNFSGASISDSYFYMIANSNFSNAVIANSKFDGRNGYINYIEDSTFANATVTDSTFKGKMFNADFSKTHISNSSFSSIENSDFRNSVLENVSFLEIKESKFDDAQINGCSFYVNNGFTQEMLKSTSSYKNGSIDSLTLYADEFKNWDIAGINTLVLKATTIANSSINNVENLKLNANDITDSNFANMNIEGQGDLVFNSVSRSSFSGSAIDGPLAVKGELADSDFSNVKIYYGSDGYPSLSLLSISGNISNVNFYGLKISGGGYCNNKISNVTLKDVKFDYANFNGAEKDGYQYNYRLTDFSNSVFDNVSFLYATIGGANFSGAQLNDVNFRGANLRYSDFRNAKFGSVIFDGAVVCYANFSGAFENGLTGEMLGKTNKNWSGINLSNNTIANADFSGKQLDSAILDNSLISNVKFANAKTTVPTENTYDHFHMAVTLNNSTVLDSDFSNSEFKGGFKINGTTLKNVDFSESEIMGFKSYESGNESYFENVDFSDCTFKEISLYQSECMKDVKFDNSKMGKVYFKFGDGSSNVSLKGVSVSGDMEIFGTVDGLDISKASGSSNGVALANATINRLNAKEFNVSGCYLSVSGRAYAAGIIDKSKITNADFSGSNFITPTILSVTESYAISGLTVRNSSITNGVFNNSTFSAKISETKMDNVVNGALFEGATLNNVDFSHSLFSGTAEVVQGTNSSQRTVNGLNCSGSSLKNVSFSGAMFVAKYQIEDGIFFDAATSVCGNFRGAYLENVSFKDCVLYADTLVHTKSGSATSVGLDFSNATLVNVDLSNISYSLSAGGTGIKSTWNGESRWYDGEVVPILMENTTFRGVSFANSNITNKYIESTANYKTKDMSDFDLSGTSLAEIDLSGQNLTNSKFRNADLSKANLEGANLTKVDLRGADLTDVSGEYTLKNTIMADGVIKNFSMTSAEDSAVIVKHTNKTASLSRTARGFSTYNGISAKISEADAVISGGAKLTIDDGALLEVVDGKSLSVDDGGTLEFNIGVDYTGAMLSLESGTSFVLDGGEIIINLSNLFVESGVYTFELIDALYGSFIGCDSLIKDGNIKLFVDGQAYSGEWSFVADASGLSVSVPEPSTYAAIFGVLALAFVIYRKRKIGLR